MNTFDPTCLVILTFLAGALMACSEAPDVEPTLGASGETLVELLRGGRADYIYCVVAYLDRQEGAKPAGLSVTPQEADSLLDWQAIAKAYEEWLMSQEPDERARIENAFPEFLETWSPYGPLP